MKNLNVITQTFITRSVLAISILALFANCKKDSEEIHEHETINRVTLTVTASDNTTTDYTWNEGETIPTINLTADSSYQVSAHFYDATDPTDVEDITPEIVEEADEHLVFFEVASANVSISSASNDIEDSDGVSINLKTVWTTTAASSGIVQFHLIHEPTNKTASTRGGIGGADDVDLSFPVSIE